ncbi:MAG: amidohydrolase [Chloroflexi bacterium]|nr:MAG: amidohydrolase [Chloroflexota bacterium]TMD83090.1 MAG: amidohydrolase [Chloroflexota bacterium]
MASEVGTSTEVDAATAEHLLTHRRELHALPELSFKEFETSRYLVERLDALSPDRLEAGVAGTGVVADLKGTRPGRAVLVRADIDALPIQEAGELAFRSSHRGVMHACGHDVHMAIALEVARAMAQRRARLSGMVRFVFQPAEERAGGAAPMIEAGVLDGIDRVIGLHVWSELPVGQVSVRAGAMMAGADMFTLTIRGLGGHGAQPQFAVDAVVIAAQVVSALQTLASRETAPAAPMVITLGSIHGGTAANIVAGEVVIQGTLRSLDPGLRTNMLRRIAELAEGIATAMRGHCEFKLESAAPPVINDGRVAAMVADAARGVVGDDAVVAFEPLMVGEDFAYFLQARPGCFFLLGGAPEGPRVGHHTAEFRIDERCLSVGFRVMSAAVLRLLEDG